VIRLLNAYFVPVYTSMEDYEGKGACVPEDERQAYRKIYHAALAKKLSTGTVHLYFLSPAGDPMDSIHVAEARPEKVIATAKSVIERLGTPEGKTLVEPRPQAVPPGAPEGSLILHLIARAVPGKVGGFWGELPGEDFIVYSREEQARFLPSGDAKTWDVDRDVALKLLHHFYPSTENNSIATNAVEQVSMKATLVAAGKVRLDATLRMRHPFYHKVDEARVDATAVGVVDFEGTSVTRFRMATEKATYNGGTFGVAVKEAR
jgi:hypothetical protein